MSGCTCPVKTEKETIKEVIVRASMGLFDWLAPSGSFLFREGDAVLSVFDLASVSLCCLIRRIKSEFCCLFGIQSHAWYSQDM